jgi:hypothetical protein
MRLDPVNIGSLLNTQAATDAAAGQSTASKAREAAKESQYEPVDSILLRRLRAALVSEAADTLQSLDQAQDTAKRTQALIKGDPHRAQAAHDALQRDRLRDLLGDS